MVVEYCFAKIYMSQRHSHEVPIDMNTRRCFKVLELIVCHLPVLLLVSWRQNSQVLFLGLQSSVENVIFERIWVPVR